MFQAKTTSPILSVLFIIPTDYRNQIIILELCSEDCRLCFTHIAAQNAENGFDF
jgi:hypothetical protein